MPTYEFKCDNKECNNEWEEFRSIKDPLPECPICNSKTVIHLISGGSGKGKVVLSGKELIEKTNADAQELKRQVYSDEKTYASFLGEDNYQRLQSQMDKRKR